MMTAGLLLLILLTLLAASSFVFVILVKRVVSRAAKNSRARAWMIIAKQRIHKISAQIAWGSLIELALIVVWAMWVGRAYLDPSPDVWPSGGEFGMVMQSHFPWTWLPKCGMCAVWNGWINGGSPTLADLYGAVAHPLVVAAMILFGLVNGTKFIIVVSLILAGVAQWWLAKVMRLSWLPRLWSAGMAVVGGDIAGRMDVGLVIFIFSFASTTLLLAPTIHLVQTGRRRTAVILGLLLGLTLLSGQGYMQLAILFGLLPALLVFMIRTGSNHGFPSKEFALVGMIALLVAAILWVPMLHFLPNLDKATSLEMGTVQSIQFIPLNLVINDLGFYNSTAFDKTLVRYLYINYIGWVPVLLALLSIKLVPRERRRLLLFFMIALGLVFILSSGLPIKLLSNLSLSLTGIRDPSIIASLAVPIVLALAAWSLEAILKLKWRFKRSQLRPARWKTLSLKPLWFGMPILLLLALLSAYNFSQNWLTTIKTEPPQALLTDLHTPTAEWVYPPYGQSYWLPFGLNDNLKMVTVTRPWEWKDRTPPRYLIEAIFSDLGPPTGPILDQLDNLSVFLHPGVEYAYIQVDSKTVPCQARALGGDIDVNCQSDEDGSLIVEENNWDGWYVKRDGVSADLGTGQWLSTAAPAGVHHYEFRYRPWDVPLGLAISLIGLGLAVWLWIRAPEKTSRTEIDEQQPAA